MTNPQTVTGVVIGPDDNRKFQVVRFPGDTDGLIKAIIAQLDDAFDVVQSERVFELGRHSAATGFVSDNGRRDRLTQNVLATQVLRPNGNWTLLGPCVILGQNARNLNDDLDEFWIQRVRDEAKELGWTEVVVDLSDIL
jgi:hypothetical protein